MRNDRMTIQSLEVQLRGTVPPSDGLEPTRLVPKVIVFAMDTLRGEDRGGRLRCSESGFDELAERFRFSRWRRANSAGSCSGGPPTDPAGVGYQRWSTATVRSPKIRTSFKPQMTPRRLQSGGTARRRYGDISLIASRAVRTCVEGCFLPSTPPDMTPAKRDLAPSSRPRPMQRDHCEIAGHD